MSSNRTQIINCNTAIFPPILVHKCTFYMMTDMRSFPFLTNLLLAKKRVSVFYSEACLFFYYCVHLKMKSISFWFFENVVFNLEYSNSLETALMHMKLPHSALVCKWDESMCLAFLLLRENAEIYFYADRSFNKCWTNSWSPHIWTNWMAVRISLAS